MQAISSANSRSKFARRLCQTPWRFTETPCSELTLRLGIRWAFLAHHPQVLAIFAFRRAIDNRRKLRLADETHTKCDFLQTRDFQSLAMFDRGDVIRGIEQTCFRPSVEPRYTAA